MESFKVSTVERKVLQSGKTMHIIKTMCGREGTAWEDGAVLAPGSDFMADFASYTKRDGNVGFNFRNITPAGGVVNMSAPQPAGTYTQPNQYPPNNRPPTGAVATDDRQARIEHQSLRRDLITMLAHVDELDFPFHYSKQVIRYKLEEMLAIDIPNPPQVGPVLQAALDAGAVVVSEPDPNGVSGDDSPF